MLEFFKEGLLQFLSYSGFGNCTWGHIIMICIGLVFIALGIIKEYEPLLLVPIGFGIIIGNIPFTDGLQVGVYENGAVLDTPGFSMYETECLEQHELDACYPEFRNAAPCRFPGCMHLSEPDCGVKPLLKTGELTKGRYERYCEIALDYQMRRKHRYD